METWRVKLTEGRKSLAKPKIQRGIFLGDALSPLLFVIAMLPLNHILRKSTCGYKLSKSQKKINNLNVHGRHQTICQKRKRIGNPNKSSENIQSGHSNGIWQRKMCHAINEKPEKTYDGRNGTT